MKKTVRFGVFESNSSSCHSLTLCTEKQYEDWKNGKVLYDKYAKEFIDGHQLTDTDKKEAKEEYETSKDDYQKDWDQLSEEAKEKYYQKYARENDIINEDTQTYSEFFDDNYFETYMQRYTTPGGEKVVAFGYYGHD